MKLSEIHNVLVKIRKEQGLSQQHIADALNVEQATISLYENGKRGIPLDMLDNWLQLLEIQITITPKEYAPTKPLQDIKEDLSAFNKLKRRRNYLIAEMRAQMAEALLSDTVFQRKDKESGEPIFWPYSFPVEEKIGLIETRYDHPEQKFLAVEYTQDEVNVYKFLANDNLADKHKNQEKQNINRIYFSEDDFLNAVDRLDQDDIDQAKMTILRKNKNHPDGVEIVEPEGFSIRSLLEIQENYIRFANVVTALENHEQYSAMGNELDVIGDLMMDMVVNNRLKNGTSNPEFVFWSQQDFEAIDIPLADTPREWVWAEEGIKWKAPGFDFTHEDTSQDNESAEQETQTHNNEFATEIAPVKTNWSE